LALRLLFGIVLDIVMGRPGKMRHLDVLLLLVHPIFGIWPISAQAYAPLYADQGPNEAITARVGADFALPSNSTVFLPGGSSRTNILCFEAAQGRETTSIDGCRSTLNYLRGLPHYRLAQLFQERRYPKEPSTPPYIFHVRDSNCAIQLACGSTTIIDRFSFEQVRALATDIVEDCQTKGGYGGVAPLGSGVGWTVKVIGHTTADASYRMMP